MIYNSKILLIGGATRNVGKTSLSTRLIAHHAKEQNIVGVKIKTIYSQDSFFHGKDRFPLIENEEYRITQEFSTRNKEDTNKMLLSGAKLVFKLKLHAEFMERAYLDLFKRIPKDYLWLVESNSLRKIVRPAVFLLIQHENKTEMKPSAQSLQKFADEIIFTNGITHNFDIENIRISNKGWELKR